MNKFLDHLQEKIKMIFSKKSIYIKVDEDTLECLVKIASGGMSPETAKEVLESIRLLKILQ